MDLTAIIVVGIIVLSIYKVIELSVRRRERIMLIEKLEGEALNEFVRKGGLPYNPSQPSSNIGRRYGVLHIAAAMIGLGVGMMSYILLTSVNNSVGNGDISADYYLRQMSSGGMIVLFTGLALVISFIIEYRMTRAEQQK